MNTQATQTTTVAEGQSAQAAENTVAPAAPALTKQEILRNSLVNFEGERIATVTKEGDLFVAKLGTVELARIKRAEDLADLLINKKHTQKAQWAGVVELKFECEVPEGTPYKAGMTRSNGKQNAFMAAAKGLIEKIDALNITDEAAVKAITKADLVKMLASIKDDLSAHLA